jgi:hypothetical protein
MGVERRPQVGLGHPERPLDSQAVGCVRSPGGDCGDAWIGMRPPRGVLERESDHPQSDRRLHLVQEVALQTGDQTDAGLEIFGDVRLAMLSEARRRPPAKRRVPARRKAVHADLVQREHDACHALLGR